MAVLFGWITSRFIVVNKMENEENRFIIETVKNNVFSVWDQRTIAFDSCM